MTEALSSPSRRVVYTDRMITSEGGWVGPGVGVDVGASVTLGVGENV